MTRMNDPAEESLYPYAETAEAVLGVPLMLNQVDPGPTDSGRYDIRAMAYRLALEATAEYTSQNIDRLDHREFLDSPDVVQNVSALRDMRYLAGQVAIANSVRLNAANEADAALPAWADAPTTPRAKVQAHITKKLAEHVQTVPGHLSYNPRVPLREALDDDGLATIAPTGAGKTVLEATFLRNAGIGQLIPGTDVHRRALVVTSTQKLVEQFVGKSGDDTFREFLGRNIIVSPYYTKRKADFGHVVVTTPRSLHNLNPSDYHALIIDEGHTALGPNMLDQLGNIGLRPYLFTATPAINEKRDLRNFFSSVEVGSNRMFIEQGVLNPARLLSFLYDDHPELLAARIAHDYLKCGRRVVVYCQPGHDSRQAQLAAAALNDLQGRKVASSVGNHNPNSNYDEEAFAHRKISALTTCRRLREGWNEDVDVVITIGPSYSELDLQQKIGRALRPGRFVSEIVELLPRIASEKIPLSIWGLFGLENIGTDVIIGQGGVHQVGSKSRRSGQSYPRSKLTGNYMNIDDFDRQLLDQLVINQPVRSILVGREGTAEGAPEGYVEVLELAERFNLPVRLLQLRLDEQEISYYGVWNTLDRTDPDREFTRWYSPVAIEFLEKVNIPEIAAPSELSSAQVAVMCDVAKQYVERVAEELGLKEVKRLTRKRHAENDFFTFKDVLQIVAYIDSIPEADSTDVTVNDLYKMYGETLVTRVLNTKEVTRILKRRPAEEGRRRMSDYLSAEDAQKVHEAGQAHREIPIAGPGHINYHAIAQRAEVSYDTLVNNMTEEEHAAAQIMLISRTKGRPGKYLTLEVADQIIARLKPHALPPYLVHAPIFDARVPNLRSILGLWLRKNQTEAQRVRIRGRLRATPCLTWEQLKEAEAQMGLRAGVQPIDYDRVVRGPDDTDEDRIAYSQSIQALYIDKTLLGREKVLVQPKQSPPAASPDSAKAKSKKSLDPTTSTPPPDKDTEPRTSVPDTPVFEADDSSPSPLTTKARQSLVAASKAAVPGRPRDAGTPKGIPAGHVDVVAYLNTVGVGCEPALIGLMIRMTRQAAALKDATGGLWTSVVTAQAVEQHIKNTFPVADPGMKTPAQLAVECGRRDLKPRHIAHVAQQVVDKFERYVSIRRTLTKDDTPGELALHYNKTLTERVQRKIEELERTHRIGSLLRLGRID